MRVKQIIVIAAVLAAAAGAFMACGKEKVQLNVERVAEGRGDVVADWTKMRVTDLVYNDGCYHMGPPSDNPDDYWCDGRDTVELSVGNGKLHVVHRHINVNCLFKSMVAKVIHFNDTIVIRDFEQVDAWTTTCSCFTDMKFCVEGIPRGHYTVQVLSESGAIVYHTEEIDI